MPERHEFRKLLPEQQQKKTRYYFDRLAKQNVSALRLHKANGLWEREEGRRDWGNVSEHCLVERARVGVFALVLGLPEDVRVDLEKAAVLHDFFKKEEKDIVEAEGLSWEAFEQASAESDKKTKRSWI